MSTSDITRVAGNIGAMNALNALNDINKQLSIHQTRLSTGKAINSAADDPAGLTIATKMNAHSQGLTTALSNIGDAQNLLSVAEAGMSSLNDIMTDMRDKAESAASDTMGTEERAAIVTQLQADVAQIDDNAQQTQWNGTKLIDGTYATNALSFQTGDASTDTTQLSGLQNMSASGAGSLGLAVYNTNASLDSIGTVTDINDRVFNGTAPTAGAVTDANLSALAPGTYTVKVDVETAGGTQAKGSIVHLLDSNGNDVQIAQNINGTGAVGAGITVDLSTTDVAVNFGNGLSANIKAHAHDADGTLYTATLVAQGNAADSYSLNSTGGAIGSNGGTQLSGSSSAADFRSFMNYLTTKMTAVSSQLSQIGAMEDRLSYKSDQVTSAQTNVQGAYNRIMNADMASEQVAASKYQILQQTATAMLSQANSAPQFLLKLFQ
ncbi:MAG: flagellin [Anaerolineaceae bacterium]|nr:flagellin [Anaerolineaceae bacterium]